MESTAQRNNGTGRKHLAAMIRERGVLLGSQQRLLSPKGRANRWMVDMRPLCMDAAFLDLIAELFWEKFQGALPFQIGGMEVAAIPLICAIALKGQARGTPINAFIVRKERKSYGTGNLVEGTLDDSPIIVVDDVMNSGTSLEKVRVILNETFHEISQIFVLVDFHSPSGESWRIKHNIPVHSLTGLPDLGLGLQRARKSQSASQFKTEWSYSSPDPNFFHRVPKSFPVTDGRRVYFGSDCGVFWCLDGRSGSVRWKFRVNARGHKNIWSAAALHAGGVYFGSYDGNVYRLDAETGAERWRFIGADWVGSSPAVAPELGLLFIGLEFATANPRGSIAALSLDTGELMWEKKTRRFTHASPAYCADGQRVCCGSNDNELFMLDAATGNVKWRFATEDKGKAVGSIRHAPAFDMARGQVVVGCANGTIYVVDSDTGEEAWTVQTDNSIYTIPLIVGENAFVGSTDKYLYVLDLEKRNLKKKIFCGSKVFSPPRFIGEKIYFGACNGLIYELDPRSLEITGSHQLADAVTNAVAYSSETQLFYALTYVNQLVAFAKQ